ncbi:MAG: thioredoxin domain-containing protein [Desulfobacteraceae bacterium]
MANHLIDEKSPYLIQHAHNPVDWFPWGETAFQKARDEDKPIFLSIGYATCHWCHVMAHESFEDQEAAEALNDAFVCIKVDREERPDIDAVYMAACQMVTGSGGWPLNVMLTPEKQPFFAATYLPKQSRFGRPGIMEICAQIQTLWQTDRQRVLQAADGVSGHLDQAFTFVPDTAVPMDLDLLDRAYAQLSRSYDPKFGGFDPAPKFPTPHRLLFLLRHHHRTDTPHALEMVTHTLYAMRQGGLWDHVGFGFHRYSTDSRWLLPHFEKMLYDQALLAMAYAEAFQVTRDEAFCRTAEEVFAYVLRDMTHPDGGFYSAEDADSEGEEGKFYVWDLAAFAELAGRTDGDIPWHEIFNLRPDGNFTDEATRRKSGANILHMTRNWDQWAKALNLPIDTLLERWHDLRASLFKNRRQRIAPLKDDKVLTDWNGLMIAALAVGARVLSRDSYAVAARKAIDFIQSRLTTGEGQLMHRFREGQAVIDAQAGDYAYLIMGLIELYRTTYQADLLEYAIHLQKRMDDGFWDSAQGGYFLIRAENEELPVRPKEIYDGALPSANSVAFSNLVLLSRLTGDQRYEARADDLSRAFAATVHRQPLAFTHFLNGLDLALRPGREVVVTGEAAADDTRNILKALQLPYAPHLVTLLKSDQNAEQLTRMAGFTSALSPDKGVATAHICVGANCKESTTEVDIMLKHIQNKP